MTLSTKPDARTALEHLQALAQFAYEQGFHELGYDPIKVLAIALSAPSEEGIPREASPAMIDLGMKALAEGADLDGVWRVMYDATLPASVLSRWIPVTERLPPINQPVITYAPDCEPYYRTNVDAWSGEDWNDHCVPVTHWAALPAPPADAEKRKR